MHHESPLDLPPSFGLHLFRAAHLWRREANKVLVECGLSSSVVTPLMLLNDLGDGIRQRELAEEMGVEGPSLVRMLDSLETAGLLERREDPADRRAKTLHMTQQGRALLLRVNAALDGLRRRLLQGVGHGEIDACHHVLFSIQANAKSGRSQE